MSLINTLKSRLVGRLSDSPLYNDLEYRRLVLGGTVELRHHIVDKPIKIGAKSDILKRLLRDGTYEQKVVERLLSYKDIGGVFVNIGANVGYYTMIVAEHFRKIDRLIAFEPNQEAMVYLRQNMSPYMQVCPIDLHPFCISDKEGMIEINRIDGMPEYSSLQKISLPWLADQKQKVEQAECRRLDSFLDNNNVSFMLIDAEGAEGNILKGAETILRKSRPILMLEFSEALLKGFGYTKQMIAEYLASLGYEVKTISGRDVLASGEVDVIATPK